MKTMGSQIKISLFMLFTLSAAADFPYQVSYANSYVDHFNQMTNGENTFKQKILFQDKNWEREVGPIFFYAGNEGPIEGFWNASGFIHELAPQFKALVVFIEHRFYGESLPFGNNSFKAPYIGYLTVDQAMADYAAILAATKRMNATNCKIIAFGGSYGGMLAAYMRFKYPNIIDGALAASAPIFMQSLNGPRDFFFKHVTEDFRNLSETCYQKVRAAFQAMDGLASSGPPGLQTISKTFKLCKVLQNHTEYQHLLGWVRNAFTYIAMLDYPYQTSFMGSLPGQPVKVACDNITSAADLLTGLANAAGVYYNASKIPCFDIWNEFIECADPTGCGTGPSAVAWDFQACTDIILPSGSNNITDMFPVLPWNRELRGGYCDRTFYGISPRDYWPATEFWGERIKSASNIIFSNGDLDPWMGGGVTQNISDSLVFILVKGGAHHLDLRASNPLDPPGVIEARQKEAEILKKWLTS